MAELIVPAIVLASLNMAFTARLTRTSIVENRRATMSVRPSPRA